MKIAIGFLLLVAAAWSGSAQSYSIDWHTMDGGGAMSTNGQYSLRGTIGQPDAGPTMSGGNFSVSGGFWHFVSVVQTVGSPTLTLTLTITNTAVVAWPSPSTGFMLQHNTNSPGTVNWSNIVSDVQDNGTIKYLIVNPPTGNRFYRLFKP